MTIFLFFLPFTVLAMYPTNVINLFADASAPECSENWVSIKMNFLMVSCITIFWYQFVTLYDKDINLNGPKWQQPLLLHYKKFAAEKCIDR